MNPCQERLDELQKRLEFSEAELTCFDANHGPMNLGKLSASGFPGL